MEGAPGEGKGYPPQYSGLENSTNCTVHGIAKSRTRLRDFHFHIPTNRAQGFVFLHILGNSTYYFMSSYTVHSWQIDRETVTDFSFSGSKITADGECSHEIKRHLLLGRKVMTDLDSILKSRDITLPTKVCLVKAMVFPVVMYGCESWTIKKPERQRIDAFEL